MSEVQCLYLTNPAGGQAAVHKPWCYSCEEDAVCHVQVGRRYCTNACGRCAKVLEGRHANVVITHPPIIREEQS